MTKAIKKFIRDALQTIFTPFVGKIRYQRAFEFLHVWTLYGMNFGRSSAYLALSGEINAFKYIKSNLTRAEQLVIFDIGANVGDYTKALEKSFGDTNAKIYSFEPSLPTFQVLKDNVRGSKNIFPFQIGFGKANETMPLFYDTESSVFASVHERHPEQDGIKLHLKEDVPIKTIDSFCSNEGIDHIDFLKMDIEGNEFDVLKGAEKMIEGSAIDFIQFEFGACNLDSRTYFRDFYYLLNKRYNLYRIVKDGLYPITTYSETSEIFMTINYLAERKNPRQ